MSDTEKRDAVLRAFDCFAPYSPAEKNMAARIVELEDRVEHLERSLQGEQDAKEGRARPFRTALNELREKLQEEN